MKNNTIVLTPDAHGKYLEGIIGDTSLPGTLMQIQAATATAGGRHAWVANAPGADGAAGPVIVLREDHLQGRGVNDAYVAGTRGFLYAPVAGEELNVRVGEVAGTGNTYAIGDKLIADAENGLLVPAAGTPAAAPFTVLETVTQVVGSTLVWCLFNGT